MHGSTQSEEKSSPRIGCCLSDKGVRMGKNQVVDLRSDTVTKPTPDMRNAMVQAEVGDDVYGEDPTVNRLEEMAAEKLGMQAAILMPTGTMGNQTALHIHCRPGSEVIVEERSHISNYEMAAMAALSGLLAHPVCTDDGLMTAGQVRGAIRPDIYYLSRTALVALENTHNMAGGKVMPLERTREILNVAKEAGVPAHLDGARIFNAAQSLDITVKDAVSGFDSVMFCLSKGLGAPVGSILAGAKEFISEARRVRKMFGGGMRQAGIIAAAGIVALEVMVERIQNDHEAAQTLADGFSQIGGIEVPVKPETNIIMLSIKPSWFGEQVKKNPPESGDLAGAFVDHLRKAGVLSLAIDHEQVRMVTHYDLPDDGIERAVEAAIK